MFRITPIQSKDEQRAAALACGVEFIEGYFAYSMKDAESGKLMGFSQFDIQANEGYISNIVLVPGLVDFEAQFILGRATMSFIDTCGAHIARASGKTASRDFLLALGFEELEPGEYLADMTNFFNGKCHENI